MYSILLSISLNVIYLSRFQTISAERSADTTYSYVHKSKQINIKILTLRSPNFIYAVVNFVLTTSTKAERIFRYSITDYEFCFIYTNYCSLLITITTLNLFTFYSISAMS